jgi:Fe2+ transport system protein FeoA
VVCQEVEPLVKTLKFSSFGGQTMIANGAKILQMTVCNPDLNGRILNSDYSGRSFHTSCRQNVLQFHRRQGVRKVSALSELQVGDTAILVSLDLPESVQNHLMHMGFVPDARVTAVRRAPAGDPTVYGIDGMEIALRHETAEAIRVRPAVVEPAHRHAAPVAIRVSTPHLREASR